MVLWKLIKPASIAAYCLLVGWRRGKYKIDDSGKRIAESKKVNC